MRCVTCGEPVASAAGACPSCGAGRRPASAAELEAAFSEAPPVIGRPRVGHDFGTRYLIQKLLGMGGMGTVYQALDRDLGVEVALKVLRPAPGNPKAAADLQRRFTSELLLARKITHRNVIRIHDIGEINGIRFISMPFIEGGDLSTLLAAGPLPQAQTLRYARQLSSGLMAVHAAGVIHRDIKPANIMVGERDHAVLMDFGIAKSSAPGALQRTNPGALVGTLAYMAPEQVRGEPVDPRTDIYAFGLVLFEMLLGTRDITTADLFARMKAAPRSPRQIDPQVPEGLDEIVTRCLQPNPAKRFQNAIELATAIAALSRGGRARTPFAAITERWLPRVAALALLLALAGLAYWAATRGGPAMTRVVNAAARPAAGTTALASPGQAIDAAPNSPAAYLPQAAAAALNAPATARATYQRMAGTGPEGASLAATGLADLALYQGDEAAAAEILEAAIARDSSTPDRAGLATKYVALAEARAGQGRRDEAVAAIGKALETSREKDVLLQAGRLLVKLDLDAAAQSIASELGANKDGHARAYGGIVDAELALGRGDTAGAIQTLRSVLKFADLWLVRFVLGSAYLQSKQYPEAMEQLNMCHIRRGEATTLGDVPSMRYLGMLEYLRARALEGAGRTREAAESFRQFLLLRGGSPDGSDEQDARARLARMAD